MIIQSKWFCRLFEIRGAAWFPGLAIVADKKDTHLVNHERIHLYQQLELLYIGFIIWYLIYQIKYGYRNNPFEIEAFDNENDLDYLKSRKWYSWYV